MMVVTNPMMLIADSRLAMDVTCGCSAGHHRDAGDQRGLGLIFSKAMI